MPIHSREWYEERFDDPDAIWERDCQRDRERAMDNHPALAGIFERSESEERERAERYSIFAGLFRSR